MFVVTALKSAMKKLPIINELISDREKLRTECNALIHECKQLRSDCGFVPPGHFYSPIPSLEEIKKDESIIFGMMPRVIQGLELHETEQLHLLEGFLQYYKELPFRSQKTQGMRYYFDNPAYSYSDAIFLYCMIRHLNPKKIIEIGSGFSSGVTLDTNELLFNNSIETTFIEPFPELLMSIMKEKDKNKARVISKRLQDVPLSEFEALGANDILFIDSTHVSKINSDVNSIFFDILPSLAPGVHIHFHDIFFPFEYPKEWVYEGRAWNEMYMLRTFLQYNTAFRVVFMNTFMEYFYEPFFREKMPLCLKNTGASIWIRKE
ncbi:class I SAM-dependent methyltransferase [Candidatus Nitrotoga arctica]|uniref:Class I SAM-dependent methyltransferase n=1 Tax=Candidatus Nitrotoga arctica TaxID=453162 RepID=A0ABN8APX7_9PROT|nr:class I SAM-dependent methyltransferase [Candidatus Nitrotoga arctica]CAG9932798.1 Class I SAM-dependent methyltransferase [Candidatus Nitrotoga arctica]